MSLSQSLTFLLFYHLDFSDFYLIYFCFSLPGENYLILQ